MSKRPSRTSKRKSTARQPARGKSSQPQAARGRSARRPPTRRKRKSSLPPAPPPARPREPRQEIQSLRERSRRARQQSERLDALDRRVLAEHSLRPRLAPRANTESRRSGRRTVTTRAGRRSREHR